MRRGAWRGRRNGGWCARRFGLARIEGQEELRQAAALPTPARLFASLPLPTSRVCTIPPLSRLFPPPTGRVLSQAAGASASAEAVAQAASSGNATAAASAIAQASASGSGNSSATASAIAQAAAKGGSQVRSAVMGVQLCVGGGRNVTLGSAEGRGGEAGTRTHTSRS